MKQAKTSNDLVHDYQDELAIPEQLKLVKTRSTYVEHAAAKIKNSLHKGSLNIERLDTRQRELVDIGTKEDHIEEREEEHSHTDKINAFLPCSKERLAAYQVERDTLLLKDEARSHKADSRVDDSKLCINADKKLIALREKLLKEDPFLMQRPHYELMDTLQKTELYKCFLQMPKPAVHHTHLTGACDIKFLVELTYYDFVYYSEKQNNFLISKTPQVLSKNGKDIFAEGESHDSYLKVQKIRQYASNGNEFDKHLEDKIRLAMPEPESRQIWKQFQPKFDITFNLYNYDVFFEKILYRVCKGYLREMVTIVEFRHIFGCLKNDAQEMVPLAQELAIFKRVEAEIQQRYPLFQLKLIICGLKFLGRPHAKAMLDAIIECKEDVEHVVGFDLVCEEDWNPKTDEFLDLILDAQQKVGKDRLGLFLHAGESTSRSNKELYDAVLLGCKRIGHGFALAQHPSLIERVVKDDICLECCPVSNRALGYVKDLRTHPVRSLITKGVKISLSPDDQGFWDQPGVTMDYICAFLAWDLDVYDLRQICKNSYRYANIQQNKEKNIDYMKYKEFFENRWTRFCQYINARY